MRKQARRFLSLLLAAAMVMSLCVCAMAAGTSPVSVAQEEPAVNQGVVRILLNADEADAVADGKYVLTYDSEALTYLGSELGSAWSADSDVSLKVNSALEGKIITAFAGLYEAAKGDLVVLNFRAVKEGEARITLTDPAAGTNQNLSVPVACPSDPFTDVKTTHWFHEYVDYVVANGLMVGLSDTTFAPNLTADRGTVITVLYRLAGSPDVTGLENPFTDVAERHWYYNSVVWAYNNGISMGLTKTTFGPKEVLTRQQLVALMYRFAEKSGCNVDARADLSDYVDVNKVQSYAVDAFSWAVSVGLITSTSTKELTLSPKASATRAQIATVLEKFDLLVLG